MSAEPVVVLVGYLVRTQVDDVVYTTGGTERRHSTFSAVVTGLGWRLEIEQMPADTKLPSPGGEVHVVSHLGGQLRLVDPARAEQ